MDENRSPYRPTTETLKPGDRPPRCGWMCGIKSQLYVTHALQAWGDRWWIFSLGLFLVILSPVAGSLRVTAINSIMISLSLILFSHVIGYWIDLSHRLHVIRVSVLCQNACAVVSNVLIYVLLRFYHDEDRMHEWAVSVYITAIISLSVLGRLNSVANNIAISKDWVVVLAHEGHFALTDVNASMRRIDMVCNIVAPIFIGFLMHWPGYQFAVLFVAAWNIVSALFEYCLLVHIYTVEPALCHKVSLKLQKGSKENVKKLELEEDNGELKALTGIETVGKSGELALLETTATTSFSASPHRPKVTMGSAVVGEREAGVEQTRVSSRPRPLSYDGDQGYDDMFDNPVASGESGLLERTTRFDVSNVIVRELNVEKAKAKDEPFLRTSCDRMLFFFYSFRDGFRIYISYNVKYAGLALSMLFLTVLNFNSVTNGYMMLQGFKEHYISLTMAASSVSGVVGTILFPFLKNRLGISTATLCGSFIQIFCVSISVVSFFLPGSPFHMLSHDPDQQNFTSVIVFASGIILSRAGLWIFDLGVTQMIQECVDVSETGRFNAFQGCLQSTFDLIYLLLVILFPEKETYAWLGFVSYAAVISACFVLVYYIRSEGVTLCHCFSRSSRDNIHIQIPEETLPATVQNAPISSVSMLVNENYSPVTRKEEDA